MRQPSPSFASARPATAARCPLSRRRCLGRLGALGLALAALGLGVDCGLVPARELGTAKVPRVGYLSLVAGGGPLPLVRAFSQGLRDRGLVEGQNVIIDARFPDQVDQLRDAAAELVKARAAVIVAVGGPAISAAREATSTIPIVMTPSSDPVASGFVASLGRPGGNITGLSSISPQLVGKRLELLQEVVPGLSRVGVVWNAVNPDAARELRQTQSAAAASGLELHSLEVRTPNDIPGAFNMAARDAVEALLTLGDPLMESSAQRIAILAGRSRLPAMYPSREYVDAGGLVAYGPNLPDLYRRAAVYVDKILKGASASSLPVEQPTQLDLIVNLQAASSLGITIPRTVLLQADDVIPVLAR
jgi:putative tryptophan/tyrosine transport system substrate-binding protein